MGDPICWYSDGVPAKSKRQLTEERKEAQAEIRSRVPRRRMLAEVRQEAKEFSDSLRRNIDPGEAVQEILDQIHAAWQYATMKVALLDEDDYFQTSMGVEVPNVWIREQERLGMQAVHVAAKASAMGLAERQVQIQEAQAALFQTVVEAALVKAGLPLDQRQNVHQAIATGLEDIEGTAEELDRSRMIAR